MRITATKKLLSIFFENFNSLDFWARIPECLPFLNYPPYTNYSLLLQLFVPCCALCNAELFFQQNISNAIHASGLNVIRFEKQWKRVKSNVSTLKRQRNARKKISRRKIVSCIDNKTPVSLFLNKIAHVCRCSKRIATRCNIFSKLLSLLWTIVFEKERIRFSFPLFFLYFLPNNNNGSSLVATIDKLYQRFDVVSENFIQCSKQHAYIGRNNFIAIQESCYMVEKKRQIIFHVS